MIQPDVRYNSDPAEDTTSEVESEEMPSLTTIIGVSVSIAFLFAVMLVGVAIWWRNGNNAKKPAADPVVVKF